MNIVVRERQFKTIRSSRSGSNNYIMCRIWCDGSQYTKCFNMQWYNTPESISKMENAAVAKLRAGQVPIDWTLQFVPRRAVEQKSGTARS